MATGTFQPENDTTNINGHYALTDGTTTVGKSGITVDGSEASINSLYGRFTYTTAQSNIEFRPIAQSSSDLNDPGIRANVATFRDFEIIVYKFPSVDEVAFKPDVVGWRIDANIAGANIDLGTSDQASYIAPNNAGLTLTQNAGSSTVGISCSTTNDNSVGSTTCAAGNEEPGIVFDLPRAGTVQACIAFAHQLVTGSSGVITTAFQINETANGSQTITQEGKSRIEDALTTASTGIRVPHNLCGTFVFSSSGKKTLRLMYEQDVTATVTTNTIDADAAANLGQRDIHITATYIDQSVVAPLLVNSVVSTSTGVTRVESARLNCDAASVITAQNGSWITSIGNISAGACAVTITTGIFSAAPYCTVLAETGSGGDPLIVGLTTAPTTTALSVDCSDNAGTDCTAYDFEVICVGAK